MDAFLTITFSLLTISIHLNSQNTFPSICNHNYFCFFHLSPYFCHPPVISVLSVFPLDTTFLFTATFVFFHLKPYFCFCDYRIFVLYYPTMSPQLGFSTYDYWLFSSWITILVFLLVTAFVCPAVAIFFVIHLSLQFFLFFYLSPHFCSSPHLSSSTWRHISVSATTAFHHYSFFYPDMSLIFFCFTHHHWFISPPDIEFMFLHLTVPGQPMNIQTLLMICMNYTHILLVVKMSLHIILRFH